MFALDDGGFDVELRQETWLVVWWGLALAIAFGVLPRSEPPPGWRIAAGGFVALSCLQIVAMAWAPSDDRAASDAARSIGYLGVISLAWLGLGPRTWRVAAGTLVVVGVSITFFALLGRIQPGALGIEMKELVDAGARLFAPLGYWNGLAAWAAASLAMALAWSADGRRSVTRAAAAAAIPVCVTVIYLTYSRGGVIAAAAGIAIVFSLSRDRPRALVHGLSGAASAGACIFAVRSQPQIAEGTGQDGGLIVAGVVLVASVFMYYVASALTSRSSRSETATSEQLPRLALVAMAGLLATVIAVTAFGGSQGFGRGSDAASLDDADPSARIASVAGSRTAYWSEAIKGFASSPLRGEGPGTFAYRWAPKARSGLVDDAHSLPLETAAELGVLGLLALAAALSGLALTAARGASAATRNAPATALCAAFGVALISFASDWTWELSGLAHLGLASAAVAGMAGSRPLTPGRRPHGLSRAALTLFAVAAGAAQVPGIVAAGSLREAEAALTAGDPVLALDRAERAGAAAPWSASAQIMQARAELGLRQFDAAIRDARRAVRGEPLDAGHRITLALALAGQGRLTDAAGELSEAVELSPFDPRLGSREVIELGGLFDRFGVALRR